MPYCLIGKIFIWGALPIAYTFFAIWAYSELARVYREPLLGSYCGPSFWIEDVYGGIRR